MKNDHLGAVAEEPLDTDKAPDWPFDYPEQMPHEGGI